MKRDSEIDSDAVSVSSASGETVSESELACRIHQNASQDNELFPNDFKNSGVDVPENLRNVIGVADGSPVVVQTGTGIKVLVEVMYTEH